MRTMTFCVGLVGLLLIAGCQNTELLQCQEENAVLVTQAADLQKKMDRQNESSDKMFIVLMEESVKSKKEIDELTQEIKTQRDNFQQSLSESRGNFEQATINLLKSQQDNKKLQAELEALQAKISASAKLLGDIRQRLQRLMQENTQLKEKLAQLAASSTSDGDGN